MLPLSDTSRGASYAACHACEDLKLTKASSN